MDFVVIDVETANPQMSSICQIGLAGFSGAQQVLAERQDIDPEDYFDLFHMGVHGISPERVAGQPSFADVFHWLDARLDGTVAVCHMPFDRIAVGRACARYQLRPPWCRWLDSSVVARRAWPEVAAKGYGLANLAARCGVAFEHHDALEDARAAGLVLLKALEVSGVTVGEWVERLGAPHLASWRDVAREGHGDGPLLGETVVMTGALSLPRHSVADLIDKAGGRVESGVNKLTTVLVVGDQDVSRLAGKAKSAKHLKAEQLMAHGQPIRIVGESDLMALVG